jgi:AcrR family transcriptional regulator
MGHREALLEGAIKCLQTKGYSRTTARDLVAASGTNLRSIGYHFGSKEQLLDEALMEAFLRWLTPLLAAISALEPHDPAQRLEQAWAELLGSVEANRPLLVSWFEALAQAERSEKLRTRMAKSYEHFRLVVSAAIRSALERQGGASADRMKLEVAASMLIALFDGLAVQLLVDPKSAPDTQALLSALRGLLDRVVSSTTKSPD